MLFMARGGAGLIGLKYVLNFQELLKINERPIAVVELHLVTLWADLG
jgi:hypothetical protein